MMRRTLRARQGSDKSWCLRLAIPRPAAHFHLPFLPFSCPIMETKSADSCSGNLAASFAASWPASAGSDSDSGPAGAGTGAAAKASEASASAHCAAVVTSTGAATPAWAPPGFSQWTPGAIVRHSTAASLLGARLVEVVAVEGRGAWACFTVRCRYPDEGDVFRLRPHDLSSDVFKAGDAVYVVSRKCHAVVSKVNSHSPASATEPQVQHLSVLCEDGKEKDVRNSDLQVCACALRLRPVGLCPSHCFPAASPVPTRTLGVPSRFCLQQPLSPSNHPCTSMPRVTLSRLSSHTCNPSTAPSQHTRTMLARTLGRCAQGRKGAHTYA